jgi:hypothetical protein
MDRARCGIQRRIDSENAGWKDAIRVSRYGDVDRRADPNLGQVAFIYIDVDPDTGKVADEVERIRAVGLMYCPGPTFRSTIVPASGAGMTIRRSICSVTDSSSAAISALVLPNKASRFRATNTAACARR